MQLNVGVRVKRLKTRLVSEALIKVTTDIEIIENAKAIGKQLESENGVDEAIKSIYEDLNFSRNQIKMLP